MSFLKKIFKSDPHDNFTQELETFKWPSEAFNVYEKFDRFEKEVIDKVFELKNIEKRN